MRAVTCGRLLAAREGKDIRLRHSQRNLNLDSLCNDVFNLSQHLELVLALDVFRVGDHHTRDKSTKRRDTISLSDTELSVSASPETQNETHNGSVDVRGTGLKSGVSVGDSTSRVVVEVSLNVTADHTSERSDELVDLSRVGASDSVSDTDTVDTDLVDSSVD